jgi:DNA-binding CsgD family transcriptional regulator
MSETALLVPIEDDADLGEQVLRLRLQGMTSGQIARRLMITTPEVNKELDKILPQLDHVYRRRVIAESLLICDRVIGKHLETIADPESASVVIRALCERRYWVGVTGQSDPIQLSQDCKRDREASTTAIERGIARLCGNPPPLPKKPSESTPSGPDEPNSRH